MPFGLTNTPALFQVLVNDVLCDMLNRSVFYLDNILFFYPKTLRNTFKMSGRCYEDS